MPQPTRNPRSRSAGELDFYPALNQSTVLSVKERAPSPNKPIPESKPSSGSLSRRNSAPLLSSPSCKKKPSRIDTSPRVTYRRPGITPTSSKPSSPKQLSTFGTVYIPSWENRSTSRSRPSTAPLPSETEDEGDQLLGGVHYSTYGDRTSGAYEDHILSYDGPFSDASVPVPEEFIHQAERNAVARAAREKKLKHKRSGSGLLRMVAGGGSDDVVDHKGQEARSRKRTLSSIVLPQALSNSSSQSALKSPTSPDAVHPASQSHVTLGTGTEQTHGTTSQEDTTLISMSKFPMPPADTLPTPGTIRPPTPGSMVTVQPDTPGLGRPTTPGSIFTITPGMGTPAVPDFLAASRTEEPESEPESRPRLRARSSLLKLVMGDGATSNAENVKPDQAPTPRAIAPRTDPSNARRRSVLERLAAKITGPPTGPDESWADESFTTDLEDAKDVQRVTSPVLEFEIPSEEPLIDLEQFQFGMMLASSPTRGATFPPRQSSPPRFFPTADSDFDPAASASPRSRTLSKLSTTGRKVLNMVDGRPSARRSTSVFSTGSKASRKSRKRHARGLSGDTKRRSVDSARLITGDTTRMRQGGRLESITRRASADVLTAEGSTEGTVMYGVGEEMLRLMFGGNLEPAAEQSRERSRSLPRRPEKDKPRATHEAEREKPILSDSELDSSAMMVLVPKGHRRAASSKENVALGHKSPGSARSKSPPLARSKSPVLTARSKSPVLGPVRSKSPVLIPARSKTPTLGSKPALKSRSRSQSAPLGFGEAKPPGILTNGNGNGSGRSTPISNIRGRVVIVNSATTPNFSVMGTQTPPSTGARTPTGTVARMGAGTPTDAGARTPARTPTRQATRSNPLSPPSPPNDLTGPGVVVTAPTPPAPRRSLSMPLDGSVSRATGAGVRDSPTDTVENPRPTVSRGTSVQFVPESYEGPRRSGRARREAPSNASSAGPPVLELNEDVSASGTSKGKRKVEGTISEVADSSTTNPSKKPKLSDEGADITFMGEPLFGGHPQRRGGLGSIDRASSHHSSYSRHSQSYSRHSQSYRAHPFPYPSPTSSPDPERSSIPIHAIISPRVQSLYGHGSEYASRRQSISSIPRPKSRASARSNGTARTGARSARSNRTGTSAKSGKRQVKDKLPMQGWCFLIGFFFPFAWWYASFARAERGYYGGGVWSAEVESQWEGVRTDVHRDDGRIDAHGWRFRCRLMAAVSIVVYVPVIVLAAVFAR